MSIKRVITNKTDLKGSLLSLLTSDFLLEQAYADYVYEGSLLKHINNLKDTTWFLIESPYTDKVYRDSYYSYFSSKQSTYAKNCIRLSLFEGEINFSQFQSEAGYEELKNRYRGFVVLRHTDPNIVGRSAISPKAVKDNNFLCVTAQIHATANSLKFSTEAFPHSSQDCETITCAETTLWSMMEYFGNKYPEYKPVLPSQIINSLKGMSAERQIPSKGLNIQQMAYALREFGFGSKIYAKKKFSLDFNNLISTYIESGIPIIVGMDNYPPNGAGNIAHALLCIGHAKVKENEIDALQITNESDSGLKTQLAQTGIKLYDYDDIAKEFVFVDDNHPVYRVNKLDSPTTHYSDPGWHTCKITHFAVPLYPKIYLEAFQAKVFFKTVLLQSFDLQKDEEILIRFYLASSRSYKNYLALNSTFDPTMREMILEIPMPKFLWIGEISNKQLIKQHKANGLVIIDATEAGTRSLRPLTVAAYKGVYFAYDDDVKWIKKNSLPLGEFKIFTNNLKGF